VLGFLLLVHVVGMMMKPSFMCFVIAFMQLGYGFILFPQILKLTSFPLIVGIGFSITLKAKWLG